MALLLLPLAGAPNLGHHFLTPKEPKLWREEWLSSLSSPHLCLLIFLQGVHKTPPQNENMLTTNKVTLHLMVQMGHQSMKRATLIMAPGQESQTRMALLTGVKQNSNNTYEDISPNFAAHTPNFTPFPRVSSVNSL